MSNQPNFVRSRPSVTATARVRGVVESRGVEPLSCAPSVLACVSVSVRGQRWRQQRSLRGCS